MSANRWRGPLPERLWPRVEKTLGGCWLWTGHVNRKGYGMIADADGRYREVHRVVYEIEVGPVPAGLELDHLCRNPRCVNPAHLDPVTHRENVLRGAGWGAANAAKERCSYGHPFTPENTRLYTHRGQTRRVCRPCEARREHERKARLREERAS